MEFAQDLFHGTNAKPYLEMHGRVKCVANYITCVEINKKQWIAVTMIQHRRV